MNPPTVGGKFAAKDVGGGVPDAPGGVKTPPYDAKDKGDTMAKAAGRARPAPTDYCERVAHERGARVAALPFSPTKTKNETATAPSRFFLKRRRKTERLAGA